MTDEELMQQALEALEWVNTSPWLEDCYHAFDKEVAALRERLAQPEQKPVAWGVFDGPNLHDVNFTEEEAQEMMRLKGDGSVVKPLYTSPPASKPWVGLTDEEVTSVWHENEPSPHLFARAIEAKLREKNT